MTTIHLELSEQGITRALKAIENYKSDIVRKVEKMCQDLASQGVQICVAQILQLGIHDTGYLYSSILGAGDRDGAIIICGCEYAVYVEFGTGVKGQGSPYPGPAMAKAAYQYLGGTTYVTLPDGRYGWFYPGDDGRWHFTEGMPSRPFMWNTAQELRNILPGVAKGAFSE